MRLIRTLPIDMDQLRSMLKKEGVDVPASAVPKTKYATVKGEGGELTKVHRLELSWEETDK